MQVLASKPGYCNQTTDEDEATNRAVEGWARVDTNALSRGDCWKFLLDTMAPSLKKAGGAARCVMGRAQL